MNILTEEQIKEYTLNNTIGFEYNLRDDSTIEVQREINKNFSQEIFQKYMKMVEKKSVNYYGSTDNWIYSTLQKYPVKDKSVLIYGSANPWYEAIILSHGCIRCDVLEYSDRPSFDEKIRYCKKIDYSLYDVGISISSFEHDGLGRYGDPLSPVGDIKAMSEAKKHIKEDGLLFLSVPTGFDKIYYNVFRVYGKIRFPLLIKEWSLIDSFGTDDKTFENDRNTKDCTPYQPLFILKNS